MKRPVTFFTLVGVLIALGVVLELTVAIPIFPPPNSFLLYSPGDLPILFVGYYFGPLAGILGSAIKALLFILFRPDGNGLWGALMNFLASAAFVGTFSVIAQKKSRFSLWIGLLLGTFARAGIMIPANWVITPLFLHAPLEMVKKILLPVIVPFNLVHSGLNSAIFLLLFPRLKLFFKSIHKQ